ncbi:hypothetical protein A3A71_03730 [Candidatus Berkelbacteria bacterium RIFCSPLOWO2_01_FULL_50_28]|uniref:Uncharacterized protein n=1 Tax=Candidatus Berkelbacteria bacterium RIFCSPLOWO2_01_FULL_50_28 TaxID=1797471 RepID=A0A1F5EAC5_9BACT|nr:MAG: hypothetical protein A3F39_01095 [Candidatus Berkelbacteria bacterium RIFCSPHIGHO2_12_FULL_50_11]OGD64260.1 MAG: hypothetical protein A3A71_03730 [Candidatus Berkelbacteria bacterium RIFCSPLOWO2_01_FULL_50_28]
MNSQRKIFVLVVLLLFIFIAVVATYAYLQPDKESSGIEKSTTEESIDNSIKINVDGGKTKVAIPNQNDWMSEAGWPFGKGVNAVAFPDEKSKALADSQAADNKDVVDSSTLAYTDYFYTGFPRSLIVYLKLSGAAVPKNIEDYPLTLNPINRKPTVIIPTTSISTGKYRCLEDRVDESVQIGCVLLYSQPASSIEYRLHTDSTNYQQDKTTLISQISGSVIK